YPAWLLQSCRYRLEQAQPRLEGAGFLQSYAQCITEFTVAYFTCDVASVSLEIMKILTIGAHGTAGHAITEHLASRGHDIITVGRTSGDIRADVSDLKQRSEERRVGEEKRRDRNVTGVQTCALPISVYNRVYSGVFHL